MTVKRARHREAALGFAMLFVLLSCDGNGGATRDSSLGAAAAGASKPFRVALLTPGPISDRSWNGGAYDGLVAIRDSLGAEPAAKFFFPTAEADSQRSASGKS